MVDYRLALPMERPATEELVRKCNGDIDLPGLGNSELAIATDGDKIVGACYINNLLRVGPFCVDPAYRGGKVSFGEMVGTIDSYLLKAMSASGVQQLPYFTFQPDTSRQKKMYNLGYVNPGWAVYLKQLRAK